MKTDRRAVGFSQKDSMLSRASGIFSTVKKKTGNFEDVGSAEGTPSTVQSGARGNGERAQEYMKVLILFYKNYNRKQISVQTMCFKIAFCSIRAVVDVGPGEGRSTSLRPFTPRAEPARLHRPRLRGNGASFGREGRSRLVPPAGGRGRDGSLRYRPCRCLTSLPRAAVNLWRVISICVTMWVTRANSATNSWSLSSGRTAYVHKSVMEELKRIIDDSEITKEDDALWPPPDRVGRQELEIVIGDEHISFTTSKIGSLIDVNQSKDPEGLRVFYYLVQDLKCLVFSLIGLHFKIKPI
eukprot:bmy_15163T0